MLNAHGEIIFKLEFISYSDFTHRVRPKSHSFIDFSIELGGKPRFSKKFRDML